MPKLFLAAFRKYSCSKRFSFFHLLTIFIFFPLALDAQVSITATAANMGPINYSTLKDAFDAVNSGIHQGVITLDITGNTNESTSAVLNASGTGSASYSGMLIHPSGGSLRSITGAIAPGNPLIDLNGPDNVTIDGLNAGGNSLVISNTTVSSTNGTCTIKFQSDATNNTITRCSILGSSTMPTTGTGGTIWVAGGAINTGNDDNTISYCDIGPAGTNLPGKCIFLGGNSNIDPGTANSGIIITGNNIFDFFLPTNASSGIDIFVGTVGTIISNNKFYQTGTRTQTGTGSHNRPISITNPGGNNYQITDNIIGFANSAGTGFYTLVLGSGPASGFIGIRLAVGTTTATSVQGNTIAGIAVSGGASGNTTGPSLTGIYVTGGLATIGDVTGNIIGSQAATGSITFTSNSTSDAVIMGMCNFGNADWTTNNNNIGGITASNSNTGAANIYGLWGQNSSTKTWSCVNNMIGGNVANSIQSTTSKSTSGVIGIRNVGASPTITGNTIRNLSATGGTGTISNASVIGICVTPTTSNHILAQNTIFNLHNSNTTDATTVTGIQFRGSAVTNMVERNFIYALTSASSNPTAEVNGIKTDGGTTTYRNNMIAIGAGTSNACLISGINEPLGTDNFFHNTVYIGGSPNAGAANSYAFNSTVTTNTRSYRDNIFVNARSNSGATGKNYAVQVGGTAANPAGLTIDNNVYHIGGTGTFFGLFNGSDVINLPDWQTAVGQDAASIQNDPQYIDPSNSVPDLHIHLINPTPIEGSGVDVGVTYDFDGQVRTGFTPVDIGADAGNFTAYSATMVTNTNDNGGGSLRNVISSAGTGSTITFSPILIGDTIKLTSGEILINKDLILSGPGSMNLTISGNLTSRIFHLLTGNNLSIENMSLKNANAITNGGALFVEGNLILENLILQHNFENGMPKAMTLTGASMTEIVGNVNIIY